MTRVLLIGAMAWPLLLGAALWHRVDHPPGERRVWSTLVYAAAGRVCHQKPERTIHAGDVAWPVCARCAGLYLAAPLGVLLWLSRRPIGLTVAATGAPATRVLLVAAVPTLLTVVWEWAGGAMPAHAVRVLTALPLGAAITWTLAAVTHRVD